MQRDKAMSQLVLHCPNACRWRWAQLKLGAGNSVWFSHLGVRTELHLKHHPLPPGCTLGETQKWEQSWESKPGIPIRNAAVPSSILTTASNTCPNIPNFTDHVFVHVRPPSDATEGFLGTLDYISQFQANAGQQFSSTYLLWCSSCVQVSLLLSPGVLVLPRVRSWSLSVPKHFLSLSLIHCFSIFYVCLTDSIHRGSALQSVFLASSRVMFIHHFD